MYFNINCIFSIFFSLTTREFHEQDHQERYPAFENTTCLFLKNFSRTYHFYDLPLKNNDCRYFLNTIFSVESDAVNKIYLSVQHDNAYSASSTFAFIPLFISDIM